MSCTPQPPRHSASPPAKRPRLSSLAAALGSTVGSALSLARGALGRPPLSARAQAPGKSGSAAGAGGAGESNTWLLVGLGNPGPRYERTRHNVGFLVIDALARSAGIDMRKLERSAAVGRGELAGKKVILAKPMTFMNNSGESVAALARFYKIPPGRVLVVSDDLDQPTAAVRLRLKGGHGGHNGLRSIIQHLGNSHDFPRLKIGIGRPPGQLDVASWVLQEFKRGEAEAIDGAVAESLAIISSCLSAGLERTLSQQQPKAAAKAPKQPRQPKQPKQQPAAAAAAPNGSGAEPAAAAAAAAASAPAAVSSVQ